MAIDQKKIELRLVVTADTKQGMQAINQLANRAAYQSQMQSGYAQQPYSPNVDYTLPQVTAPAAGGGGGGGKFGMNDAKGLLLKGAGGLAAITGAISVVNGLSEAVMGLQNPFLTAREKAIDFAKAIPVVGSVLANFMHETMDMIDRFRDPEAAKRVMLARFEMPLNSARESASFGAMRREMGLRFEVGTAQDRLSALERFPTLDYENRIGLNRTLRGGNIMAAAGSFAFGAMDAEDPRSRGAREGIRAAERALEEAKMLAGRTGADATDAKFSNDVAFGRWRTAKTEAERQDALAKSFDGGLTRDAARKRIMDMGRRQGVSNFQNQYAGATAWAFPSLVENERESGGSRLKLIDALNQEKMAMETAQRTLANLEEKITKNKEAQLDLLRKQHDLTKAQTGLLKVQKDILDEEYSRSKSAAGQFGLMDDVARDALLTATRRFKDGGRQAITAQELSLLQGNTLTNQLVEGRAAKDAGNDAAFKELLKLTGARDAETINMERQKVKAELDMKIQLDEEQFARLTAEKLKTLNLKDLLGEIVRNQLEIEMRKPRLEMDRGRLERGG